MIKINKIISSEKRNNLRKEYIKTLVEPIDGYWETVVIDNSECYEIIRNDTIVGHFSVDKDKTLVQFYLSTEHYIYASDILKYFIENNIVKTAYVSTKEPDFLSVCLDYQKSVHSDTYLFTDNQNVNTESLEFRNLSFRLALKSDINTIKTKCDVAFEGYYEGLINNNQLFVLYDDDTLLGIGEFRIMASNIHYADIGVVVAEEYRRKGMGTYIITKLKKHCYNNNLKPLACCDIKNIASKNTLQKSGFICNHRIIHVNFN
ncbi:GNAT family N-acetyltransferase [Abyssisolibacter fermentans]|uniref:GNAT family N-acetyltransferase n=1 Tax=Abyssisolibacter fermentans TaxID=1766203 RepID=UPI0008310A1B|nr:GNAT family N-acetyltransferase [Abyssisolibacter fermentans]